MGGNTANLLQDIRASKNKLTLTSQTVTQAHSSFTTQSTELMNLIEQLESKFQELEKREEAVVKEEKVVKNKKLSLQTREQKCIEREQKLDARERAVAEKETKWIEAEKKMQQNAAKIPNYVQLSISGTKFTVAKEKLMRYKGSLFEQVIVSDHPPLTPKGEIFFERDPFYFQYIIRFLLDDDFKIPPSAEKQAIKKEFGYYNIPCNIADLLHLDDNTGVSAKIKEWLPEKEFKLLYKASEDGYKVADFHKWCDNKGPTLTMIRSTNGSIFGGYSTVSRSSSNSMKKCDDAFIFTLTNPHNIPPTKYACKDPNSAIYDLASYGPCFGSGCDIAIKDNSHSGNFNYTNFPHSYTDTTGKGRETFTGTYEFTVQEIEIFSVY